MKKGDRRIERRGKFIVVDGLDAIGKGEILRAIDTYEQKCGKAVFDSVAFCKANRKGLPEIKDFWNPPETYYDTIITSEPTYAGIGHNIRNIITSKNSEGVYGAEEQICAYGLDRLIQMNRVVIPALRNGLTVLQSRCWASTRTYQILAAEESSQDENVKEERRREILRKIENDPGNVLQMAWSPDLLIIPTIQDVTIVIERLNKRGESEKDDHSIFENLSFQQRLKPLYEDADIRGIFERCGTKVAYLDAGVSVTHSKKEAVNIYRTFLDKGDIPERNKLPETCYQRSS